MYSQVMKLRFAIAALALFSSAPVWSNDAERASQHPLAVHMNQWLVGSREWSTPNPNYKPDNPRSFKEFRVRWDWGPLRQQLQGKLFGVRADRSAMLFWNLYATHNPVTGTVLYQQIGRGGAYIQGESPAREQAIAFGEVERLDTMLYGADGSAKISRHENIFKADGSHHANVYERNKSGDWELKQRWDWKLLAEDAVLGGQL